MIKPEPVPAVPRMTARVARAAFPKGNLYLRLREEFGSQHAFGLEPWALGPLMTQTRPF